MRETTRIVALLAICALTGCGDPLADKTDRDGDGLPDSTDCAPDDLFAGAAATWYEDADSDGFGDASSTKSACTQPAGYVEDDTDCDDSDEQVYPGADETWYDGIDGDCAGGDDNDQDGDGFPRAEDCDDTDASIVPSGSAEAAWYDGVDSNCDGNDGDQDGDGWYIDDYAYDVPVDYADHTGDCYDDPSDAWRAANGLPDPRPADVYPGAPETFYDGLDEDCAGGDDFDADGDSYTSSAYVDGSGHRGTDCDDTNPDVNPGELDSWYDGVDTNCSGNNDYDKDGDGYATDGSGEGLDCDDADDAINPGATESCRTEADDDCDGETDATNATGCTQWHADLDGDGYGGSRSVCRCAGADPYTLTDGSDCSDSNPDIYPTATEVCNGDDDDCDGRVDDGLSDCVATSDTGVAQAFLAGNVVTDSTGFVSGDYGLDMLRVGSLPTLESVCSVIGPTTATAAATACADCDWAYSFTVTASVMAGDHCADFGFSDGDMDGTTGEFGWADTYDYYGTYTFTDTLFYYFSSYGKWYPIAFQYAGSYYGGYTSGDHSSASFEVGLAAYYYFYN